MTVSGGIRPSRLRSVLAAVLAVLILVPAALLFTQVWQQNADQHADTDLKLKGVEYLAALSPLVSALTEAQSSALQEAETPPAALPAAVTHMASVDQRLGEDLRTRERWINLRESIARLASVKGEKSRVFQAHVEVSSLALALARTVADTSTLSRDPDNDVSHLQQAAAIDVLDTVVQVSRMGDLSRAVANIRGSATERAQSQAILLPQFGAAVSQVNSDVAALTDDLQAAVDDTASVTLSGSLVSTVDAFRRGVEEFIRYASPNATVSGTGRPNQAALPTAQSQLQMSLASLSGVLVRELNGLLEARQDRLDQQRIETVALAGALLLLVLTVAFLALTSRPRFPAAPTRDETPAEPFPHSRLGPPPPYGETGHDLRERTGAVR